MNLFEHCALAKRISEEAEFHALSNDGEISDEIVAALDASEIGLSEKAEAVAWILKSAEGDMKQIDDTIIELNRKKQFVLNKCNRLKKWILLSMTANEIKTIKAGVFSFSIVKNGGPEPMVIDETVSPSDVPIEYRKVRFEFDTKSIRDALMSGVKLSFASLGDRENQLRLK